MQRSNAFREPSQESIRHLSEIDDPDLDIFFSSNNDVLRSRMLEEDDQDHEDRPRPKSRSGSFGSQVDSLFSSDSDPSKSVAEQEFVSRRSRNCSAYSGSEANSFCSQVDSLYISESSQSSNQMKDEIDNDMKSLKQEVLNDINVRPKSGVIYSEISGSFERIMERLEYLSKKEEELTIEDAIEISDVGYIFELLSRPEDKIVGFPSEMAYKGANLILQAEQLNKKGYNLLDRSKSMLLKAKSNILDDHETSLLENGIDYDLRSPRLQADRDLSYYNPIHNEITEMDRKRSAIISFKKETNNDLKFASVEANIEINERRKTGVIYKEFSTNIIKRITERLEHLSKKRKSFTIDEAIEIDDAIHLLRIFRKPEEENIDVTLAGKFIHDGVIFIHIAEKLAENGRILLDKCKYTLSANLKYNTF